MRQVRKIYDRIFKKKAVQLSYRRTKNWTWQSLLQMHPNTS